MPPVVFEPTISASKQTQTYALDRASGRRDRLQALKRLHLEEDSLRLIASRSYDLQWVEQIYYFILHSYACFAHLIVFFKVV
jgi:hypothetical protein